MKRCTVKPPSGVTSIGSKYGVIQEVLDTPNELFKNVRAAALADEFS